MSKMKISSSICAAFVLSACASSSHVVTGTERPAVDPTEVTVYSEAPSEEYEVIATVTASSSRGLSQQGRVDAATEELVEEASKLGANGVIIKGANGTGGVSTGISTGISGGSRGFSSGLGTSFTIHSADLAGTAIYVSKPGVK